LKKVIKINIILFHFIFLAFNVKSQDIHFSQFWTSSVLNTPSNSAFFDGNVRLALHNRTQWAKITKPYQTNAIAIDFPIAKRDYYQDIFGLGISVFRDLAGDSKLGTTQFNIAPSYIRALNRKNNNFLSVGFQASFAQRNIYYSSLYFDEQFSNGYFNQEQNNTENFKSNNFNYFDFSAGVSWLYIPKNKRIWNISLSVSHLNRPSQTFFNEKSSKLDFKTMMVISTQYNNSKDNFNIFPLFMASFQGGYSEIIFGGQGKYFIDNKKDNLISLNAGLFYRYKDATYISLGIDYRNLQFGLSYDINVSKLSEASRYQGGWEFSLVYIFKKQKVKKVKNIPCPIF